MLAYRYLFAQLVARELRRKYKGSRLGVLWHLVNPLVLMGAYTLMFGHVFQVQRIPDFPVFLMVGIVVWTFFQQSLVAASESLIDQGSLVRKARFPRESIPAASVAVQLITFLAIPLLLADRSGNRARAAERKPVARARGWAGVRRGHDQAQASSCD